MLRPFITMFRSLSATGMLVGLIFFAMSLTPSLMPRSYLVQGALSGVCAATGYMIGVGLFWLWRYLELPYPEDREQRLKGLVAAAGLLLCIWFLWHAVGWQNSIRTLWAMPPLDSADPFRLAAVASVTFLAALILGRIFQWLCIRLSALLKRYVPRRVSLLLGILIAFAIFWSLGQGVLLRLALDAADASFQRLDALIDEGTLQPGSDTTGSASSLISWEGLGRQGRHYVSAGPGAPEIGNFWREAALQPIRVYVGLNNADTAEARARLALAELRRQGGFERRILVVIAPTGTGWIDPAAMDSLEYLHRGDVASVALQYSYLTSWLSLLVEPDDGQESAQALFKEIYSFWKTLPRQSRPQLYLYGLSLGAFNSQLATDIYDVVADPFQGALWAGPPFRSARWRSVTAQRNPASPAWLPRFRDGSTIRFTNQSNHLAEADAEWGPIRFIYLQYASDPIVFFEPASAFKEPAWMREPRGPDVSRDLQWLPIVTMLQLLFDMAIATSSPLGFGHVYAPEHYIDCWISLTGPPNLEAREVDRLKQLLRARMA
ncbi:alpha/beta-hydrolase family protein [Rhizobium sp. LC145]|jgi:uncharacterized membrane protein|uniref:alpha/beta hydrolase n=1 Tax=Rhizobium sp. LC145 TaxID=1120688 RepID=UPI000629FBA7|nr:alpha/beta-hydrolase family protein [Rhizobium sp. LC145]KKX33086.1 membrane protein [Rhizobium sp. LC145]TKT68754.1 hypothetical protein FDR95_02255 [Rhizobiaceae bacterium LC148]